MSKQTFTGARTSDSWSPTNPGSQLEDKKWHAYVSGVFGAGGALQVQFSPDPDYVTDSLKRWFSSGSLNFTDQDAVLFEARARSFRFVFTGGDTTTNIIAEIV